MQSTAFQAHDHSKCVTTALRRAQDTCAARQVRLTPIRQRVLEILLESHRAMGAYDVLGRLSAEGLADKPPVAKPSAKKSAQTDKQRQRKQAKANMQKRGGIDDVANFLLS